MQVRSTFDSKWRKVTKHNIDELTSFQFLGRVGIRASHPNEVCAISKLLTGIVFLLVLKRLAHIDLL